MISPTDWLATRQPATAAPTATAEPATYTTADGTEYDLALSGLDVVGACWTWTGQYTPDGEPLMDTGDPGQPIPLDDVHHWHGPLVPVSRRTGPDYWDAA